MEFTMKQRGNKLQFWIEISPQVINNSKKKYKACCFFFKKHGHIKPGH